MTPDEAMLGALLDADGAILGSSAERLIAVASVKPEDFGDPQVRTCWNAAIRLVEHGQPVNPYTVFQACRGGGQLDDTALGWLQRLHGGNHLDLQTFGSMAADLRRAALLGMARQHFEAQLNAAKSPRSSPREIQAAEELFIERFAHSNQPDETADIDLIELSAAMDHRGRGSKPLLIPTGIEVLDEAIGGWVPNLNVVGGLPGLGKSSLAAEIVVNQAARGLRLGFFGLEEGTRWIAKRHMARAMGWGVREIGTRDQTAEESVRYQTHAGQLSRALRNITVYRHGGISADEVVQKCRHWILNLGVQCIYIDHGGEIEHQARGDRNDLAVGGTYKRLRDLALRYQVPIVVMAHFGREKVQPGQPPPLDAFAESAYIERMARVSLGLWKRNDSTGELRVQVTKASEGKPDICVVLELDVEAALVRSVGGRIIDLRQEKQDELKAKQLAKAAAEKEKAKTALWKKPTQQEIPNGT